MRDFIPPGEYNLPPGCTSKDIEDAQGERLPCDRCEAKELARKVRWAVWNTIQETSDKIDLDGVLNSRLEQLCETVQDRYEEQAALTPEEYEPCKEHDIKLDTQGH